MQYHRKPMFASAEGGVLSVIDRETGEAVVKVPVRPGLVPRAEFAALEPFGYFELSEGLVEIVPASGYAVQPCRERYATGANPDYQPPTAAERLHEEMRVMVNKLAQKERRIEARLRAAERLTEMPTRQPQPEPHPEVIDPEDNPESAAAPAPVSDDARQ